MAGNIKKALTERRAQDNPIDATKASNNQATAGVK